MSTLEPNHPLQAQLNASVIALVVHAAIILIVTVAVFVLAYVGKLNADAVLGIYGSIIGYSGGAATANRVVARRTSDGGNP